MLANRNVPNRVKPILSVIGGLPAGTPAGYEAAFGWGWLLELLEGYGFEPHLGSSQSPPPNPAAGDHGHRVNSALLLDN